MNDPEWEEAVKNLKDDHERREFAIESFGNAEPSDPTKNMTYHGYLRQQLRLKEGIEDEENPEAEDYIGEGLRIEMVWLNNWRMMIMTKKKKSN